ncbi:MAG: ABC transporter permease [Lachnospiraceae bacterium]|nr:ABC transporter permease [Lachnospiraceae bacterium]MDD3795695.1 ABC transporter permease [Lachnospiraceae bacterium]
MFDADTFALLGKGIIESLYMTAVSSLFSYLFGLPLGILLVVSERRGLQPRAKWLQRLNAGLNAVIGFLVNIFRSIPFLILLIMMIPVTRKIVGTTLGPTAVIVPLVIAATPYIARMVESSIKEVDDGMIEAAKSMGASTWQIVCKVLIPEAKPSLINGAAISVTTILSYSALAGATGGGGLGDIAIRYGYYRYETGMMMATVVLLVAIVQLIQVAGTRLAKMTDKRIR